MSRDAMSDLMAVTMARAEELLQPKPSEAVLAACDLFLHDAEARARRASLYIVKSQPPEKD